MPDTPPVIGLLLAGGLSRRMGGGDKTLRLLAGRPVLAHVIERIQPQVRGLCLNANGDPARFAAYGLPVVPDSVEGFVGPLAGVLAGLEWAAVEAPKCGWVATAPTDAPFLPRDLVARLLAPCLLGDADMSCATSAGQAHPVVGLWPVSARVDLRRALVEEQIRKVDLWTARYRLSPAEFSFQPGGPFFSANPPSGLAATELFASPGAGSP